jgi:D-serine deaminase-like pyridoxal phosphate-dependent protein
MAPPRAARLHDLPTPAAVLDVAVLQANLQRMADRADDLGVALRPHVKTHKCVEIAVQQRHAGARGLSASTLAEAQVFADHGFDDVTLAIPLAPQRAAEAEALSERIQLRVVVDSHEAIDALEHRQFPLHAWLKVDCGYHRAGVEPSRPEARALVERLASSRRVIFDGLLTHAGHSYWAKDRAELERIAAAERAVLVEMAESLRREGIPVPAISVGSTPTLSAATSMAGVNEVRPGNYAFHDYTQVALGACSLRDCALTVLATVISSPPGREHSVIDAGALALSKDLGPVHLGHQSMGELLDPEDPTRLWDGARVLSVTQEHGIINRRLKVGTRVRILVNHSCLTAAQFDHYDVVDREQVVGRWRIWRTRD